MAGIPAALSAIRTALYTELPPAAAQAVFTGGVDGRDPFGVIRDRTGSLYGTAEFGGTANLGVVFSLDLAGSETVLHSFTGGLDGAYPRAGVIRDSAGRLYGTTQVGGRKGYGGVLFEIHPASPKE
jgi:uncharacterized repeat protein (TIGR03803 family)